MIRMLLTATVLVLALAVLVAQNTLPSKEAAPAGSGQVHDNFTDTGTEYLIYTKNDMVIQLNPSTGDETPSPWGQEFERMIYKGNLGEWIPTQQRNVSFPSTQDTGPPGEAMTVDLSGEQRSAVNGNVIITNLSNPRKITIYSEGVQAFTLRDDMVSENDGDYVLQRFPMAWIDKTHLIVSKGTPSAPIHGVSIIDITTGEEKVILKQYSYIDQPMVSPSGRYIAYVVPTGEYYLEDYETLQVFVYDLETNRTIKLADPGNLWGWTTKQVTANPADAGFLFAPVGCSPYHCVYNNKKFKPPFKCGEAYRVTRDGQCNTPSECGLNDGGYPLASWNQTLDVYHPNKRAIDFSDNNVGGGTNDNLPVLAAANGVVTHAGWENPLIQSGPGSGAGYCVWIKHSDNTYTLYGHMKVNTLTVSMGDTVDQGETLGTEGCTGECTAQHIHFARSTSMNGGTNSYWMEFDELGPGSLPIDEHIYLSRNGGCSICGNTITLLPACGGIFTGQSTVGQTNYKSTYFVTMLNVTGDNAASVNESGPEKVYLIVTNQTGAINVQLSNVSNNNLNVFVLKANGTCKQTNPLLHCKGVSTGLFAITENLPPGPYYIIVDGKNGASGSYTLNVAVTPCQSIPNLTDNLSSKTSAGRNITVTARVRNDGSTAAGAFKTRFWLSTDPNIGNDYLLGTLSYSGLSAGGVNTFTHTWTAANSIPAGTYYLIYWIDYATQVSESNENDNAWYFGSTIYLPPAGNNNNRQPEEVSLSEVPRLNETYQDNITELDHDLPLPVYNDLLSLNATSPVVQTTCNVTVSGHSIISSDFVPGATYILFNALGRIVCQGKANQAEIECPVSASGIYFLSVIDEAQNICVQKIFVN